MLISDARRRANDKWRDKFDEGKKEVITAYAAAHGESINAFINRLIDEEMAKAEAEK